MVCCLETTGAWACCQSECTAAVGLSCVVKILLQLQPAAAAVAAGDLWLCDLWFLASVLAGGTQQLGTLSNGSSTLIIAAAYMLHSMTSTQFKRAGLTAMRMGRAALTLRWCLAPAGACRSSHVCSLTRLIAVSYAQV
jgi:hypothetical protein